MEYNADELIVKLKRADTLLYKQQETIETLRSENDLLSSTIINNKLGKINEERRNLQQKIFVSESKQRKAEHDLKIHQDEYNSKNDDLNKRLQDVKLKQAEINKYIMSEANKVTKDKRRQLQKQYDLKAQSMEGQYVEKEAVLNKKIAIRNKIIFGILAYAILITTILIIQG